MLTLKILWLFFRALLADRQALVLENLALRQQLAVLYRQSKRPKLTPQDRGFWLTLSKIWTEWASALVIVKPATGVRWHRQGFKYYWRWKSGKPGRPEIDATVRALIRRLSEENTLWGAPRIQAELALLGHEVAESTVAKYMGPRPTKPPSQSWKTFVKNHVAELASIDFFVVPTATFRLLFCFVVLRHDRRQVVHFNVTEHPTSACVTQQIREAFPFEASPRYLMRDRDSAYGDCFRRHLENMGIEEILTAPRSPWQNAFVERLIGTIRRECLDHLIVLNEGHLQRILADFFRYYHTARCHQSLDRNAPVPREVEPPDKGRVIAIPHLGGLHHRYTRVA